MYFILKGEIELFYLTGDENKNIQIKKLKVILFQIILFKFLIKLFTWIIKLFKYFRLIFFSY